MDFIQNAKNTGILEEDEAEEMLKKCGTIQPFSVNGKILYYDTENMQKDLDYFQENIYNFYYEKKTGDKLKELIKSYKNEQNKELLLDRYVSLKQLGEDKEKRGKYVQTKVLHALAELLRQGESLALLHSLNTKHKEISLTELTYLVNKFVELLFGEINLNELEEMENESFQLYFIKFNEKLNGMTYAQLMEWFQNDAANFDDKSQKFFDNFLNFFEITAESFIGISEHKRKLGFCYELLQATTELLQKSLNEFKQTPHEKNKNTQSQFLDKQFYNTMVKIFIDVCSLITTKIGWNSRIKIYEHIPADFVFEEKISRTFRMLIKIPFQNIAKMLETIDWGITKKCANHFWHLNDEEESEEIENCANRLDFNEIFQKLKMESTGFANPQPIYFFNILVSVLHCQHQASVNGAKTWVCPFNSGTLPQIASNGKIKFAILNGLLQFGRRFNTLFRNYMISNIFTLYWNIITIPLPNDSDDLNAVKNSFTSGPLKQMFSFSGGNVGAEKTVYISMENIWQMLITVGSLILSNCKENLWHLADKEEEIQNCSKKLHFGILWAIMEKKINKDQLILLNMIALESISKAKSGAEKTWTTRAFHHILFTQIGAENIEMEFAILKGLLQFGNQFNKTYGTWIVKASGIPKKLPKNQWNNITIHISEIPIQDWNAIKASFKSGQLKQIFISNSSGNTGGGKNKTKMVKNK